MENRKLSVVTVNTPNSECFIYTDFTGRACFDFLHKILFFSMQKRESLMGKLKKFIIEINRSASKGKTHFFCYFFAPSKTYYFFTAITFHLNIYLNILNASIFSTIDLHCFDSKGS